MKLSAATQRVRYRLACLPRSAREADRLLLLAGTLRRIGWTRSVRTRRPVSADGVPLPWLTYPAIHWLHASLRGDERTYEFGSGSSTTWLAARTEAVSSVEHDPGWYEEVRRGLPENADVSLVPPSQYAMSIAGRGPFDLVLVDGIYRSDCIRQASGELTNEGAIVVDNSDRLDLQGAMEDLAASGFARIDFAGPAPGLTNFSCTSVLSRRFSRWGARRPPTAWGTRTCSRGSSRPCGTTRGSPR